MKALSAQCAERNGSEVLLVERTDGGFERRERSRGNGQKKGETMRAGMMAGAVAIGVCFAQGVTADTNEVKAVALPDIVVTAERVHEEAPVGPYQQPEWTQHRRFPSTRVYLQDPPWNMEFEQWCRLQNFRDNTKEYLFQEELTLGLPHRFQADAYYNWTRADDGTTAEDSIAAELRYAFADWGQLPLNPTLYLEYKFGHDKPDACEAKILLGDQIAPRWHWGANVFVEQETRGEEATETGISAALGYTVLDETLGVGLEMEYAQESIKDERSSPEKELLIGPSVQWRPIPRIHIDVVPLFGVTDDSPRIECFGVLGYDFGSVKPGGLAPKSTESR
jgi:hypothetical protein